MDCDPNYLSQQSSCLRCLSDSQLVAAQIYLLCAWFNAGGGDVGDFLATEGGDAITTELGEQIEVTA